MEPLEIVSHTDQVPLQGNLLQSTQRELLKTQNPLNNPNDRFDACLAGLSSLTPSAFILAALPITALFLESNQITEY